MANLGVFLLLAARQMALAAAIYPPPPPFLSNVFGNHMVLQRDRAAILYGFAPAGAWVNTSMTSGSTAFSLSTVAGADGVWRQTLPAQPASAMDGSNAWAFAVTSAAENATIVDVLFGDVHMCTGQRCAARPARSS